ncbi:hypothetical protein AgCh_029221 [Apium graveolens]
MKVLEAEVWGLWANTDSFCFFCEQVEGIRFYSSQAKLGTQFNMYYDVWFASESVQPFFYWLDIGDDKDVNLEKCQRNKLQLQYIKYLGPGLKWIFVLSTSRNLYVGKKKGEFQHSSFLFGGATMVAGDSNQDFGPSVALHIMGPIADVENIGPTADVEKMGPTTDVASKTPADVAR